MYKIDDRQAGRPYPLGVTTESGYTYFSVVMKEGRDCGIILYDKRSGKEDKLPFSDQHQYGSIFSMALLHLDTTRFTYNFYEGDRVFTDPYAKVIQGHDKWGKQSSLLTGGFLEADYDWEGDSILQTPYEDSILYCLNVRAFTKHKSSGVSCKGTFQGIIEKIPYLQELGITAVEFMPVYEFEEMEAVNPQFPVRMEEAHSRLADVPEKETLIRCNCWGYKEGYYFSPKPAYAWAKDAVREFKDLVKAFHRQGIEVILQFYFPDTIQQGIILDAIRYWALEYHIDGFHLKGEQIPIQILATDPLLTHTKLFYSDFPWNHIYQGEEIPQYRNLAIYRDDYMYGIRRFLKGDEGMLSTFLDLQRRNPSRFGVVNYVTNYYGFTLIDMVSYEKKHNLDNGEENQDGSDDNVTWNCGIEGCSRRKTVQQLRLQQMKNALTMLFFSQGIPLIYSGDELANTRFGNNNPYCQDNETGWVKWKVTAMGKAVLDYTRKLIQLKKSHPILRQREEMRILDYIACGYPDLSYHGEEAWRPDFHSRNCFVGMMYCGCYAQKGEGEDDFFYLAYNMHWQPHTFALPKLPRGMKWHLVADTGEANQMGEGEKPKELQSVELKPRSIQIYISSQEEGTIPDQRKNYIKSAY